MLDQVRYRQSEFWIHELRILRFYLAHQDLHQRRERLDERLVKLLDVGGRVYHGAGQGKQLLDDRSLVLCEVRFYLTHVRARVFDPLGLNVILTLLKHLDVVCDLRAQENLAESDNSLQIRDAYRGHVCVVLLQARDDLLNKHTHVDKYFLQ